MRLEVFEMSSKFIMLVGLPASSKSTYAIELSQLENAIILSSDSLREELYGDANHQDNNGELFHELYKRAKQHLTNGHSVIVDATNISQKRRIHTLNEFKDYHSEVYYFNTPFHKCINHDRMRERTVGKSVIDRMYRQLQIPTYSEGWNKINIIHDGKIPTDNKEKEFLELAIDNDNSHDYLFAHALEGYKLFDDIYNLSHDSKYHSFSVSRHTYYVWEYIRNNYQGKDKLVMLWTTLLHDVGKAHCKEQKEGSRYFQFLGHENVGAQLSCQFLRKLGYDDSFILKVVELVQLHMRLLQLKMNEDGENTEKIDKLLDFVGGDVFQKLKLLREADTQAH